MTDTSIHSKRKLSSHWPSGEYKVVSASPSTSATLEAHAEVPPPAYREKRKNDQDLVLAAEALALLTNKTPPPASDSQPYSPTHSGIASPLSSLSIQGDEDYNMQHPLVSRVNQVSRHPLVTNAVRYYNSSKRNYALFNYAAGIVEKAALPVVSRIEADLNSRHQVKQAAAAITDENELSPHRKLRRLSSSSTVASAKSKSDAATADTRKRLQFCLHVLKLANDQITAKVNELQGKIVEREQNQLQERERARRASEASQEQAVQPGAELAAPEAQKTKTEIVTTVKKIIHVISNFRPSSLSTTGLSPTSSQASDNSELKSTIRDIILQLPNTVQQTAVGKCTSTQQANDRIFVFAKESLDMITRLTTVFSVQLEKADNWVAGEQEEDEQTLTEYDSDKNSEKKVDP